MMNVVSRTILFLLICIILYPLFLRGESGNQRSIPEDIEVTTSPVIVRNIEAKIFIFFHDSAYAEEMEDSSVSVIVNGTPHFVTVEDGKISIPYRFEKRQQMEIKAGSCSTTFTVNPIPLWMSVLPPLIAILIALIFREVYSALFIGLLVGTTLIAFYQGNIFIVALGKGILMIADTYILKSIQDTGHLSIIVFSMLIGAMVNLITRNGGMKGVVNILSRYARSPRSGQFITWLLGIMIFFDDYANTLVVGNTMRPVTDKLRISREKLSYIVDSTAAPIAAIAFVTTWIGAELGYIQDGINNLGIETSAYSVFLNSLAYSFYPVFALLFILIIIHEKKDFGPMLIAEQRARRSEKIQEAELTHTSAHDYNNMNVPDDIKARWFNAVIPVLVIIIGTIIGLVVTGLQAAEWDSAFSLSKNLSIIIGNSDSYKALLWSSISGVIVAVVLTITQRIINLKDSVESLVRGFKTMLTAILILILAWSIALITKHLHTADFISRILVDIQISPYLVPAITFILSALVAFSTGSSWGTMAILYPLILPSSWLLAQQQGLDYSTSMNVFYNVVSTVLAGSVLGDHCSPISDTTILSSLASSCNHIDHVRTQLPYAALVGAVSVFIGTIPAAYGISSWILFPAGIAVLYLILLITGRKV